MTAALSLQVGIRQAMKSSLAKAAGPKLYMLNAASSFVACSAANFLNAYIMRYTEVKTGIDVLHPETMESVGVSKNTASKAVLQTATSRMFFSVPMFLPPIMLGGIGMIGMIPSNFALNTLL